MRSLIIGFVVFLAACNGSTDNDSAYATTAQLPPNESTQVAALRAEVSALEEKQTADDASLKKLQLIGQVRGTASKDIRMQAEFRAVSNVVNFGPCTDMGIFQGRGGSDSSNPVGSQFEIYKTEGCADSSLDGQITSYSNITGQHDTAPYLAWDDSTCGQNGGTLYIETDEPSNFYAAASTGGVFSVGGQSYWIKPGQTPEPIMIQSAINTRPGGGFCGIDQEVRMVVIAVKNDFTQSGIPDSLVANSWTQVAP